jgi:hypothetical protein
MEDGDMSMDDKPLPGIRTRRVEDTKAALPEEVILPVLDTIVPTRMALPDELIEPSLITEPVVPDRETVPDKKSESDSFKVEAMKSPPVITEPVEVITMPLGLMRYSEPEDLSRPAMEDMEEPVTRFKVAPVPLLKNTEPPCPMEKPFQFIIALPVLWFIVIEEPDEDMVPLPAAKEPPIGRTGPAKAELGTEISRTATIKAKRCLVNMDDISLAPSEFIFLRKRTIKHKYKRSTKSKNIKIPLDFLFA